MIYKHYNLYRYFGALVFFMVLGLSQSAGQIGGAHVFEFLSLSSSARNTGLGEHLISVKDDDLSLAYENPAILSDTLHGTFTFNHLFFFNQINHGYFSYASTIPKWKLVAHGGIKYISYGDFTGADIFGNKTGIFKANEMALILGASKRINSKISLGINTKWIQSRLESYNSFGFAADLGVLYSFDDKNRHFGLVFKNIGLQFNPYAGVREELPFDIQLGMSQKLRHLPFRFSIVAHHLHRWNILYDDPNEENTVIFIGDSQEESRVSVFTDNLFRHLIFSGEFLIGKNENVKLRLAYNHLKRRELSVDNYISLAGFSMGVGIKISRFIIDYGYSISHLAGGSSHIGISMNVNRMFKKI